MISTLREARCFIKDDAGRSKSKRPHQRADCSVRTIARLFNISYDSAYDRLADAGRKCGRGFDIEAWGRKTTVFIHRGAFETHTYFRLQKMPYTKDHHAVGQAKRYRIVDFLKDHPKGHFAVLTAKHVFAVVNGVIYDDIPWHFLENRPVYAWMELHPVRLPLWRVYALRKPLTKGRAMFKRSVAIVEGASYKLAMKTASKQYEWAIRPNEDINVEPYHA